MGFGNAATTARDCHFSTVFSAIRNLQPPRSFTFSYLLLVLSNICTVVEEFYLNTLFNLCEHAFITISAVILLIAIYKMTSQVQDDPVHVMESPISRDER